MALEYAAGLPEVDRSRVAVWGSSLGGGHAIAVAARHPELRAAVAQCPFTDGLASAGALGLRESPVRLGFVAATSWQRHGGKNPFAFRLRRPGRPGLMTAADALPGTLALVPEDYERINRAAARSVANILRYRPGRSAKRIAAPILICISATDSVAPPEQTERYARQAPHGDVRLYAAGHFDFYLGDAFEQLVTEETEFLVTQLQPARVSSDPSSPTVTDG